MANLYIGFLLEKRYKLIQEVHVLVAKLFSNYVFEKFKQRKKPTQLELTNNNMDF